MRSLKFFSAFSLLSVLLGVSAAQAKDSGKTALRLAWREAFQQGAHDDLSYAYPEVRWRKPSRWQWTVVEGEEDIFVVRALVRGKAGPWRRRFRSTYGRLLLRFPGLLNHLRPPRPFSDTNSVGRWEATRSYRVSLVQEAVEPVDDWAAHPSGS